MTRNFSNVGACRSSEMSTLGLVKTQMRLLITRCRAILMELMTRNPRYVTRPMFCVTLETTHTTPTLRAGFGNPDGD